MRTTSSISFYCRSSKANKKGLSPIEVSLIINQKRVFFNLPRKERPEDFQKLLKKRSSDLAEYLELYRTKINEVQTELLQRGIAITAPRIREYLKSGGIKTYTIEDLFNEYLLLLEKRIGIDLTQASYEKYLVVRDEFFSFKDKETEAGSITSSTIASFYAEINSKMKLSTTSGKMTKLKTIFRYAFDSGKIQTFPFNSIKIRKSAPLIQFLTPVELKKIESKRIDNERLSKVRDLFLFQANSGLSYADMAELKPEDLQEHNGIFFIKKPRVKTGIEYTAVVMDKGIEIFNRYNGHLPILTNQKYNCYLKEIEDICNIHKNITTHLARKTYATLMLNAGVSITTVSKLLGHSNTLISQRHYAKTWDETILNEVKAHI